MVVAVYKIDTRLPDNHGKPDPSIPFQRFYLVPKSEEQNYWKLTTYGLIVPLTSAYDAVLKARGLDRQKLTGQEYQVLVPVHMARLKQETGHQVGPTYFANKSWWTRYRIRGLEKFFPEETGLVTPEAVITPLCLSCENQLEHITGACQIGTPKCMQSLKVHYTPVPDTAREDNKRLSWEEYKNSPATQAISQRK